MAEFEIGTITEASSKRQILAALVASFGALTLGSVLGWTVPALKNIPKSGVLGELTENEKSWIASSAFVGAAFGYPVATVLLKRMGRRMTLLSVSVSLILAWILMSCSDGVVTLISGRVISGLCAEAIVAVVPIYVEEIAGKSPKLIKCLYLLFGVIGVLISFIFGFMVDWLWLSILCATIPMFFICGMVYMPETPQYFLSMGKYRFAQKSVQWLNSNVDNFEMNQDLSEMKLQLEEQGLAPTFDIRLKDILSPSFIKPFLTSIFLVFTEQFSGIYVTLFYLSEIFESFNLKNILHNEAGLVILGSLLVGSVIVSLLFTRENNTKNDEILLRVSKIGIATCMGILGCLKYLEKFNDSEIFNWIAFSSLSFFAISYGLGLIASSWAVMENITPIKYRGWIYSSTSVLKWSFACCVTKYFYEYYFYLEYLTFLIFSGVSFVGFIVSSFCLPRPIF